MNSNILKDSKTMTTIKGLISAHGSTAAMIGGFGFFGVAIWAAFKASKEIVKAREKFDQEKEKIASEGLEMAAEKEKMREIKTSRNISYIMAYRWVILFGAAGTGLMLLTKIMDGHAIATWAGIAATQKDKLEKFGENAKKIIGEEKFKEIQDKTLHDEMLQSFMANGEPLALEVSEGGGEFFFNKETKTLFQAKPDELTEILDKAKEECSRNHGLAAVKLYEDFLAIDISGLNDSSEIEGGWWGPKNEFDYKFDTYTNGVTRFRTVEWVRKPTTGKAAGVPGFTK